jgi:putative peptidoglycan lipid II flippase
MWIDLPINQTVLPIFRHDLAKRGEHVAWSNLSALLNNLFLVFVLVALGAWLLAPYIVALVAPGFADETGNLATSLTRILMADVVLLGIAALLSQLFLSYEKFVVPGIGRGVNNLVIIAALILLGRTYGIYGLAVAVVIGAVAELAINLPILWSKRKWLSGKIDLRHPTMLEMGKLSFPVLISTGGMELGRITDRIFASLLAAGSLSSLAFGHRLLNAPLEFLLVPLQKSTFPHFTKLTAEGNFNRLSSQLFQYLRLVVLLTIPVALVMMVIPDAIVRTLYQRGAFDETSTRLTSEALFFYAMGLPALAMSRVLNRTYFSLKDTWTPAKLSLIRIAVKVGFSWIFIHSMGHGGVALAESLSQIIRTFFLLSFLPEDVKGEEIGKTWKSFGLTMAGAIAMVIVIYPMGTKVDGLFSTPSEFVVLGVLGVGSYALSTFFFQREEFYRLVGALASLKPRVLPKRS